MIGWLLRRVWRLVARRLGWVAVVALARSARALSRRGSPDRVDEATAEVEDRLPGRLRDVLDALPGDATRLGGRAVVTGRSARQVAVRTRRAAAHTQRAAQGTVRAARAVDAGRHELERRVERVADLVDGRPRPVRGGQQLGARLGRDVRHETEQTRRRLRSRMLGHLFGPEAADDALLDVRSGAADEPAGRYEPPAPPDPIAPGRRRAPRRSRQPKVDRVQRTYHPPPRPWDR